MGTKNLWVLCVSMCLGVFGVYSCEDGDELENERRNNSQEENVEDGSDTMSVVSDTTQVIPDDTLTSENVRRELDNLLAGKKGCISESYPYTLESIKYGFNADHSGYISYRYWWHNTGSHARDEYRVETSDIDVDFTWEVLSEKVFSIHSVSAHTRANDGTDYVLSYEGSVRFQLDKLSPDRPFFLDSDCGSLSIFARKHFLFDACDEEPMQ
ncbi:MAG: hypothetical protein IKN77_01485 [Paludibacteraceae bacterium]|nr:hypothetical protein [Paludibacteraceae bacterium]